MEDYRERKERKDCWWQPLVAVNVDTQWVIGDRALKEVLTDLKWLWQRRETSWLAFTSFTMEHASKESARGRGEQLANTLSFLLSPCASDISFRWSDQRSTQINVQAKVYIGRPRRARVRVFIAIAQVTRFTFHSRHHPLIFSSHFLVLARIVAWLIISL